MLVGGYYGAWLAPGAAAGARLDDDSLREHGAALGAGVLAVLPDEACPVAEVARVVGWMAGESAGQCGPCVHGLAAIAGALGTLADGAPDPFVLARLARWSGQVQGRGACHHPDGVVRFLRSALDVFAARLRGPPAPRPLRRLRPRARARVPDLRRRRMSPRLTVDPIACSGHGACAELFPERIGLDDWGYPMLDGAPVPDELLAHARRAVAACPTLALRLAKEREAA